MKDKDYLHMREVEVIDINGKNVARDQQATATQSSTFEGRPADTADRAVNGIIAGWDDRQTTRPDDEGE